MQYLLQYIAEGQKYNYGAFGSFAIPCTTLQYHVAGENQQIMLFLIDFQVHRQLSPRKHRKKIQLCVLHDLNFHI